MINKIHNIDCLKGLKELLENSVDSVITDPPYGLSFMGKKWDYQVPSVDIWKECLRVLKPGGYLLSFAGTRTQHRMAVNIEDAGFEIRDMIAWVYGSGFPKSLSISKQLDKAKTFDNIETVRGYLRSELIGETREKIASLCQVTLRQVDHWIKLNESQPQIPSCEKWNLLKESFGIGDKMDGEINWINRGEVVGKVETPITWNSGDRLRRMATTPEAKQWDGWGTALKPALEPITVARKPLSEKTIATNVLKWGTGGINIDGCRIGNEIRLNKRQSIYHGKTGTFSGQGEKPTRIYKKVQGRFPANFIHDGSEEVEGLFPNTKSGNINSGTYKNRAKKNNVAYGVFNGNENYDPTHKGDSGSASRFFYCAKASKAERNLGCEKLQERKGGESYRPNDDGNAGLQSRLHRATIKGQNNHPTVKPLKLIQYLVKLVTPKGGIVLDPFIGSGTTALACRQLNRNFIGFEIQMEYCEIAKKRLKSYLEQTKLI